MIAAFKASSDSYRVLTCRDILGRFISYDISCRNYSSSIFGVRSNLVVQFGRLVNKIWPSGFYFFARPDSAVWAIPKNYGYIKHNRECFAAY